MSWTILFCQFVLFLLASTIFHMEIIFLKFFVKWIVKKCRSLPIYHRCTLNATVYAFFLSTFHIQPCYLNEHACSEKPWPWRPYLQTFSNKHPKICWHFLLLIELDINQDYIPTGIDQEWSPGQSARMFISVRKQAKGFQLVYDNGLLDAE